jgi:hypothetical protein
VLYELVCARVAPAEGLGNVAHVEGRRLVFWQFRDLDGQRSLYRLSGIASSACKAFAQHWQRLGRTSCSSCRFRPEQGRQLALWLVYHLRIVLLCMSMLPRLAMMMVLFLRQRLLYLIQALDRVAGDALKVVL